MEPIEIIFAVISFLGGIYIVYDALVDRDEL
jgi:hypothetical protein